MCWLDFAELVGGDFQYGEYLRNDEEINRFQSLRCQTVGASCLGQLSEGVQSVEIFRQDN
jgi:hypothetical protein